MALLQICVFLSQVYLVFLITFHHVHVFDVEWKIRRFIFMEFSDTFSQEVY